MIAGSSCRSTLLPTSGGGTTAVVIGDPSPRASHYPIGRVRDGVGGRILSIATTPDGRRVYAATLRAGVWRSDDAGIHWRQMGRLQPGDGPQVCPRGVAAPCTLPGPFVADIAVSPADPDLVFAASSLDTSNLERDGVYRSSDGGETWQLVHQFTCSTIWPWKQHPPVGQILFAPDDPTKLWAAGGCTVAYSVVAGSPGDGPGAGASRDQVGVATTWHDAPAASGNVWHVAVARSAGAGSRAVYACGPNQLWISSDGGQSFASDPGAAGVECSGPGLQGHGPGASVIVVDPSNAGRVFIVGTGGSNGPVYFDQRDCGGGSTSCRNPNGNPCGSNGFAGCGQGNLRSATRTLAAAGYVWRQEPAPPVYSGAGSLSGSVTLIAHERPGGGYLLIMTDEDTVHVSVGAPTVNGWHRLDGPDASALCPSGAGGICHPNNAYPHDSTGAQIHMDTHPIAVDAGFDLTLRAPPSTVPAEFRHNTELASCTGGTIFMGNDGGLVRSTDCGAHVQYAEDLATLIAGELAAVPRAGGMPALYFGGPDNDPYYSPDGGANWRVAYDFCGDCQGFYVDALQTRYVVHQWRGPGVVVWTSGDPRTPPDATGMTDATRKLINLPDGATEMIVASPGPVIQSLPTETPPAEPDLIWPAIDARGVTRLWRHRGLVDGGWTQEGPDLPSGIVGAVAQPSGGHASPVYYVAGRTGANPWDQPNRLWRSHRADRGAIDGWDCIVPGPFDPSTHDGRCAPAPITSGAGGTVGCAAGRACRAWMFAASPYDPQVVYISDHDGIKISTDGGQTWRIDATLDDWLTADHTIGPDCRFMCSYVDTILRFSGIRFIPNEPEVRFAVGEAGVFITTNGISGGAPATATEIWHRLWDSSSMACEPGIPVFVPTTTLGRSLYVPCHGRSLLSFHGLPTAGGLSTQIDRTTVVRRDEAAPPNTNRSGLRLPPEAPAPDVPQPTTLHGPLEPPGEKEKESPIFVPPL